MEIDLNGQMVWAQVGRNVVIPGSDKWKQERQGAEWRKGCLRLVFGCVLVECCVHVVIDLGPPLLAPVLFSLQVRQGVILMVRL